MSVSVIGLGAMGGAIAARLAENGFSVIGFDVSEEARQRFSNRTSTCNSARASGNLTESVNLSDVIITSLPNDDIVNDCVIKQIMPNMKATQTFIEMSTILPQTMKSIAEKLEGKVDEIVDSPVSGGPLEASDGNLSLLVGCQGGSVKQRTLEILSKLGTVNIVGKVGDGKSLKLVNNMMSMGNIAVAMEAFQMGANLGLDPDKMYQVLSKSGGGGVQFNKRGPFLLKDDFFARFAIYLAEKDTRLALETAHKINYHTPILANIHQMYQQAMSQGLGHEDILALIKLYRK